MPSPQTITALALRLDREEYSRFEPGASTVGLRLIATPRNADLTGNTVILTLRTEAGRILATQEVVFSAGPYPSGVMGQFDLNVPKDGEINLVRAGRYQVVAELSGASTVNATAPFVVSVVTVAQLKALYCSGIDLITLLKLSVASQPFLVTGVTVAEVSPTTPLGPGSLSFVSGSPPSLSWRGGTPIPLQPGRRTVTLPDTRGNSLSVLLDEFLYPDANGTTSEILVVERDRIKDSTIQSTISMAVSSMETRFKFFLEPHYIATEPFWTTPHEVAAVYDRQVQPFAFYSNDFNTQAIAWHLNFNQSWVLRVDKLDGYLNDIHAIELNHKLIEGIWQSGSVDILPYSQIYGAFFPLIIQVRTLGGSYISNFWRYVMWSGLPSHLMEPDLLKAIGYKAAIPILTQAGQARQLGVLSESNSRDGVSRSRSYNPDGDYASTITQMQTWLHGDPKSGEKGALVRLHRKLRGLSFVTL